MSLILDALRKMELERKAKRQSSTEIRTEVLNYRGAAPVSPTSRSLPIIASLLIVSVATAGFFYIKISESVKSESVTAAESLNPAPPPVITPQSVQPLPSEPMIQKSLSPPAQRVPGNSRPAVKAVTLTRKNGVEGITISGIAWQDERYLRRAVINGSLVGEGAEIAGAKVVEIRENRVKFSRGGEVFEVDHTSGSGR